MRRANPIAVIAVAALLATLAIAGRAAATPAQVTEFPLPPGSFYPGPIAVDEKGEVWFANTHGVPGRIPSLQEYVGSINRIAADGAISSTQVSEPFVRALAGAPGGGVWLVSALGRVGRVSADGKATYGQVLGNVQSIALGPDGNLWFTQRNGSRGPDKIGRLSPDGEVALFPLPGEDWDIDPRAITPGPDGNLWFAESVTGKIGRITPSGEITELELPAGVSRPAGIAVGPYRGIWFTRRQSGGGVGRIDPDGSITALPGPSTESYPGPIVAGGDGRLWFVDGRQGLIGRVTPDGRFSYVRLPNASSYPVDIARGPDGAIWYAAHGEGPCPFGGSTCMAHAPTKSGVIGRIASGPLSVQIRGRGTVRGRRARIRLRCGGGTAQSACRGPLSLRVRGTGEQFGRFYALPTDSTRLIGLRLGGRALRRLRRDRRLIVRLSAELVHSRGLSRRVVLRLRRPAKQRQHGRASAG